MKSWGSQEDPFNFMLRRPERAVSKHARRVAAPAHAPTNSLVPWRLGGDAYDGRAYSTVTDFARFLGWSTSVPLHTAVW
jgi:hypothetical protein